LSLKPSKCKIGFDKVNFLGHTLQKGSTGPQFDCWTLLDIGLLVGSYESTRHPETKKECRRLLGTINFYRRYIRNCAMIIAPNNKTHKTKNRAPNLVECGDRQERAFTELKRLLSSEPILKLPDLNREFILQTDASNQSLGGCLLQEHDGVKHPVMYAGKKLIPREQNYSVGERGIGNNLAVKKFHRFLYGQHFTLECDHRAL